MSKCVYGYRFLLIGLSLMTFVSLCLVVVFLKSTDSMIHDPTVPGDGINANMTTIQDKFFPRPEDLLEVSFFLGADKVQSSGDYYAANYDGKIIIEPLPIDDL